MLKSTDTEPDDEIVSKHIRLTSDLLERAQADADRLCGGSLSFFFRRLLRKHYKIKERDTSRL